MSVSENLPGVESLRDLVVRHGDASTGVDTSYQYQYIKGNKAAATRCSSLRRQRSSVLFFGKDTYRESISANGFC